MFVLHVVSGFRIF